MTTDTIPDIEYPTDDRKSRLARPARSESPEDVTTAPERIDAFWAKHPDGSIMTEVETTVVEAAGVIPYLVFTVRAYVRRHAEDSLPAATAHATRGQNDEDELVRQFPQETAETAAVSRALRNAGILTSSTKPAPPAAPEPPAVDVSSVAVAREKAGLSQKQLAEKMRGEGVAWSQAVVSKVERGGRALKDSEAAVLSKLIGLAS